MTRILATLGVACLALIALAASAEAQTAAPGWFDIVRPYLLEIAGVFVAAVVGWLATWIKAKLGIDIEARHREALQAALTNAAGLAIARAGDAAAAIKLPAQADQIEDALDYVKKAAPDAMKHFGIGPADIREKLRAKIGVLAAGALPAGRL